MKSIARGIVNFFYIVVILLILGCDKQKSTLKVDRSIDIECDANNESRLIVASFRYSKQNTDFAKNLRFKIPRDSGLVYAGFVEGKSFFMISTSKKLYKIDTDRVVLGDYSCSSDGYFDLKDFETSDVPPEIKLRLEEVSDKVRHPDPAVPDK